MSVVCFARLNGKLKWLPSRGRHGRPPIPNSCESDDGGLSHASKVYKLVKSKSSPLNLGFLRRCLEEPIWSKIVKKSTKTALWGKIFSGGSPPPEPPRTIKVLSPLRGSQHGLAAVPYFSHPKVLEGLPPPR